MIIMALPVDVLFSKYSLFEGFQSHDTFDYESHIVQNPYYGRRGDLEVDLDYKQPIPYVVIVNRINGLVYAYQRASEKEFAHEDRLHGKWSLGVGGHVEPLDGETDNPIRACFKREVLKEEVDIKGNIISLSVLGYINESDPVGKVHFGILYVLNTDAVEVFPKDKEMKNGFMVSLSVLERILGSFKSEVEGWSRIAYEPLKNYFLIS